MLAVDATLLIIFVIVWILLFVLKKVFFKPLKEVMTKRDETIAKDLKAGEESQNRCEAKIHEIEEKLKAARQDAKETRERFIADALREKEQILMEIGQECRAQVDEAKGQLEKKVEALKKELASQSKVLSDKIEQRLLH
ncbi:MAG: ATP synthase F0 subunit B [Candidatus Aminicenantes bacterium]|jgi:F-type H+-transporting ATPase subunit b